MSQSSELRPLTTLTTTRPTLHNLQPTNNKTTNEQQPQPLSATSSLHAPDQYSNPSSSVSRASSARSTSSVQAVPFRIPTRLTSTQQQLPQHEQHEQHEQQQQQQLSSSSSNINQLMITNVLPLQNLAISSNTPSIHRPPLPRNHTGSSVTNTARKGIKDFIVGDILGEGSYSTVYHVTDRLPPNKQFALKVLDKRHIQKEKKTKYVAIERDTLNLLDRHPGCIRLYSTFQDESSLYYLLEYAPKGEILKSIKTLGSFSTDCARFYAAQLLSAIEHMHSRGVIHRDIKPENILLDSEMRIKIADFGSAKILNPSSSLATTTKDNAQEPERSHSFVGTAEYVSPELLVQKVTSQSSDLWAFGCVLFQMIAGIPPFRSRSEYLTFQKITHLEYEFPVGFPTEAQDLVTRLLVLEPEMRIGASAQRGGIEEIKAHPFFETIDWHRLWELVPPVLQPGLVVAAHPPDSLGELSGPIYPPDFFDEFHAPPPLPSPDSPLQPDYLPPPAGLGLALLDTNDHTLLHNHVDNDEDDDDPPESKATLGNALSRRKSWLLGGGRRKIKEDPYVCSSSGEMTWAEVYLPNELVIYSSVINELWGPNGSSVTSSGKPVSAREMMVESLRGKKKKKRQLILTDFPRLLCVKEDAKSSKVRVKFEVLFKPLPTTSTIAIGGGGGGPTVSSSDPSSIIDNGHCKTLSAASSSSNHSASTNSTAVRPPQHSTLNQNLLKESSHLSNQFLLFKNIALENSRCFRIETVPTADPSNCENGKAHVRRFEDKSEAAERWTDEINLAFRVANNLVDKPTNK